MVVLLERSENVLHVASEVSVVGKFATGMNTGGTFESACEGEMGPSVEVYDEVGSVDVTCRGVVAVVDFVVHVVTSVYRCLPAVENRN